MKIPLLSRFIENRTKKRMLKKNARELEKLIREREKARELQEAENRMRNIVDAGERAIVQVNGKRFEDLNLQQVAALEVAISNEVTQFDNTSTKFGGNWARAHDALYKARKRREELQRKVFRRTQPAF